MTFRELTAEEVGPPRFVAVPVESAQPFDLASHRRAREALELALTIEDPGFNVFVVGEERSGRMTATLEFLSEQTALRPPPDDWIYVNNFKRPHRPRPISLPAGRGRLLRDNLREALRRLAAGLAESFQSETYRRSAEALEAGLRQEVEGEIAALSRRAESAGLTLVKGEQGMTVAPKEGAGEEVRAGEAQGLLGELAELAQRVAQRQSEIQHRRRALDRRLARETAAPILAAVERAFAEHPGILRWLAEMAEDILENLERLRGLLADRSAALAALEGRYGVNLLVDRAELSAPEVVLEPNPTYEQLFGRIEYRQVQGALSTDFTMIRAGALHRANGGILVLRAEAIARNAQVWEFLKSVLRDRAIRIEEPHRAGAVPVAGAPRPKPIPFAGKVVLVGSPRWYYSFFASDPDFQSYFKIKAEIDGDLPADEENLGLYAGLLQAVGRRRHPPGLSSEALAYLLAIAAREAGRRDRLVARYEAVADLIVEAARQLADPGRPLGREALAAAWAQRRRRNARVEERMQREIARGLVLIDTAGSVVGQVNALTVRDLGDYAFGSPTRVTARASVGRRGLVNIERDVELGGPIQQKGVMVLQGFLAGHFARRLPLSFNCSVTFEQSYGGVEGDSASLAELLAVLSDLAGLPLRQDIAITGSVNQVGQVQAVGGVLYKVEGFFRTCLAAGPLSGSQGVVVPRANESDLVLTEEVSEAVAAGRFHLYSVTRVEEAIELLTGLQAGTPDSEGNYPPESLYGAVQRQIALFDAALIRRNGAGGDE